MNDPRLASGKGLGDRLLEMERRLAMLEAASGAGLLGTDQTIKGCHDRLDAILGAGNATVTTALVTNLNADLLDSLNTGASGANAHVIITDASGNTRLDGQLNTSGYSIRGVFIKALSDASATSVFRIGTTNAAGDTDGGAWACTVRILVANGYSTTNGASSAKALLVQFGRAQVSTGAGVVSAVTEICETASAATTGATRDLGAITVTTTETSEYEIDVQINADATGSGSVALIAVCSVELLWAGFGTMPTLTQL